MKQLISLIFVTFALYGGERAVVDQDKTFKVSGTAQENLITTVGCKSPMKMSFGNNKPILLANIIAEKRLIRRLVKHVLLQGLPLAIFIKYCRILSLLLLHLEVAGTAASIERMAQIFATGAAAANLGRAAEEVLSRAPSPNGAFPNHMFPPAASTPVATSPVALAAQRRVSTMAARAAAANVTPVGATRVTSPTTDPFARSMDGQQSFSGSFCGPDTSTAIREKLTANFNRAAECLEDALPFSVSNYTLNIILHALLPTFGICLLIFSHYFEPLLDERIGRSLIKLLDQGVVIQVPNNEFIRLLFDTFATGGYMFDSKRIVQSITTLRAACLAIEHKALLTKVPVEYVYWTNGGFLKADEQPQMEYAL